MRHDMPPLWDGHPVEWTEWEDNRLIFICPPPKHPDTCNGCGTTREPAACRGVVYTRPGEVPAIALGRLRPQHMIAVLYAWRCPRCGYTEVADGLGPGDNLWVLDDSDYGDEGSWPA